MRKRSKYDAKKKEIIDMLAAGMNYKEVTESLVASGFPARIHGLYTYCQRMDEKIEESIPHCEGCKHHYTPEAADVRAWRIRICLNKDKQILGSCGTSPMWCPRREHDE